METKISAQGRSDSDESSDSKSGLHSKWRKPEPEDYGQSLMAWRAPEYEQYQRGKTWYVTTLIFGIILIGVSIWMRNYLLMIIIVLFGIVFYVLNKKEALILEIMITDQGIKIGEKFYPYNTIEEFWLIYDPPIRTLNIKSRRAFFPEISVPLAERDPNEIREILIKYGKENTERTEATITDRLSWLLKI